MGDNVSKRSAASIYRIEKWERERVSSSIPGATRYSEK
jgi:hypothetical protein